MRARRAILASLRRAGVFRWRDRCGRSPRLLRRLPDRVDVPPCSEMLELALEDEPVLAVGFERASLLGERLVVAVGDVLDEAVVRGLPLVLEIPEPRGAARLEARALVLSRGVLALPRAALRVARGAPCLV